MSQRIRPAEVTHLRIQLMSLARRLRREAHSDEQSWARLLLLGAIDRHGGTATPSALAADQGMQSSNLAAALRDLASEGLIARTPDSEDRRKVRVALSEAGRALLRDNRARREGWLASAMGACLSDEESALLVAAGELIERIATYSGEEPA